MPEFFGNGKYTMAMLAGDKFKSHGVGAVHGILIATRRAKRVWQRKGTNFSSPHFVQPYMAPPNAGSPQLIIRSTVSITC